VHIGFLARPDRLSGLVEQLGEMALAVSFGLNDGVDDQADPGVRAVQLGRHRVDEEGHVVVHDLDDGVGRPPAVLFQPWVVDPHLRLVGRALLREPEQGQRRPVEVVGRLVDDVVGRHVGVEQPQEGLGDPRALGLQALADPFDGLLDQIGFELFGAARHLDPPLRGWKQPLSTA
jgi:hypothetical protein